MSGRKALVAGMVRRRSCTCSCMCSCSQLQARTRPAALPRCRAPQATGSMHGGSLGPRRRSRSARGSSDGHGMWPRQARLHATPTVPMRQAQAPARGRSGPCATAAIAGAGARARSARGRCRKWRLLAAGAVLAKDPARPPPPAGRHSRHAWLLCPGWACSRVRTWRPIPAHTI